MSIKVNPGTKAEAVTTSDATTINPPYRALWVGVYGDVKVDLPDGGTAVTFKNVQGILPVEVTRVYATGTTSTNIVGIR